MFTAKRLMAFVFILNTVLLASNVSAKETEAEKKARIQKQIEKEIQKEKKYKNEQTFYQSHNYDYDHFKVDQKTLNSLPEELDNEDDFDMNSVYD